MVEFCNEILEQKQGLSDDTQKLWKGWLRRAQAVGIAVLLADDNLLDQSDFMRITNVLSQWAHSNHQSKQKTRRFMKQEYRLHFQRLSWCWGIHLVQVAQCATAVWAADWALGSGSLRQEVVEWCWPFAFLGNTVNLGWILAHSHHYILQSDWCVRKKQITC